MGRTIKFRGRREDGTIISPESLWLDGITVGPPDMWFVRRTGARYADAVPEQFTGQHDRNGREIYEGDVVEFTDCISHRFRVEWHGSYAAWSLVNLGDPDDRRPLSPVRYSLEVVDVQP